MERNKDEMNYCTKLDLEKLSKKELEEVFVLMSPNCGNYSQYSNQIYHEIIERERNGEE